MADEIGLALRSAEVVVRPEKGCEIYSWTDQSSGVDVLFKTRGNPRARTIGKPHPTRGATRSPVYWVGVTEPAMSILAVDNSAGVDNRGYVRTDAAGIVRGLRYAGSRGPEAVRLHTAPLRLHRRITLSGRLLTIDESVTNTSPDEVEFMWSHHPAFGPPFLGPDCVLSAGARTVLAAGSRHPWPHASTADGAALDLSVLPPAPAAQLAYLTDFTDVWFTITNPRLGLRVELRWPTEVFGHAWLWQELHSSAGYPWWREAYVCAIEPASTIPGQGIAAARRKGSRLVRLAGGETREVTVAAALVETEGVAA